MDGANMNAQVGLTNPGYIGADVCHLNLHKTFAMPSRRRRPGRRSDLRGGAPPQVPPLAFDRPHRRRRRHHGRGIGTLGFAMLFPFTYGYIKMLGGEGLKAATEMAIVNAKLHVVGPQVGVPHLLFG